MAKETRASIKVKSRKQRRGNACKRTDQQNWYERHTHIFHEIPLPNHDYCYAITIAASELAVLRKRPSSGIKDEELGVHLVNAELQEVYDSYCQRNPVAVNETCSMLFERCSVPAEKKVYAYVLFTILHEIGHWKHLIQSGLSSMDYWKK